MDKDKIIADLIATSRIQADKILAQDARIKELEQQLVDKQDSIEWLKDQIEYFERNAG